MAGKRKRSTAADVIRLGMLAPLVVSQRLSRIATATPATRRSDANEWQRMTSEKLFGAQESWLAAAVAWQQQLVAAALKGWSPWSPFSALAWWQQRQVDADIVGAAALAPVVRRVSGNAKRLARRR